MTIDHGTPSGIRVGVKAAIVRDGSILLVEYDDESGVHFNLPGGGVELGKLLHEAMRREVREETCAEVEVGRLLLLHEYEPRRARERYGPVHKLTVTFECSLAEGSEPAMPERTDPNQTAMRWTPLAELRAVELLPGGPYIDALIAALASASTAPVITGG